MDIVTLAAARKYADTKFLGFVPKGAYNPANENKYGEWYTHEGGSYGYIYPTPSTGVPVTDTTHWQQIASIGMTGPSAYDAAVAGGYTGTEAEFNAANAGIEAAVEGANDAAGTANAAAENAETAAYRSMLWRKTAAANPVSVYPVPESPLYPKVSGTFTQSGTGDPSPSNIRPITPWLANGATAKVKRTGKNLFGGIALANKIKEVDPSATLDTVAKTITYVAGNIDGKVLYTEFYPNKRYTFIAKLSNSTDGADVAANLMFAYQIPPSDYSGVINGGGTEANTVYTKANVSAAGTPVVALRGVNNMSVTTLYYDACGLFEGVLTVADFEPYTESEITLTAPQEIAAGWMDNEGHGQGIWGKYVFTGLEVEQWEQAGSGTGIYYIGTCPLGASIVCSHYVAKTGLPWNTEVGFYQATDLFRIRPNLTDFPNLSAWKAYLVSEYAAGHPVTIYYQLATPIDITPVAAPLTALPQVDRVIPKANVLTASTGNVELTYAKSPIRESDDIAAAIAAL